MNIHISDQYHCTVSTISRGAGQSAVASAAYRKCTLLTDHSIGKSFNYSNKGHHVAGGFVVDPETLATLNKVLLSTEDHKINWIWNEAQRAEKHPRALLAREMNIALPNKLNVDQWASLSLSIARALHDEYGVACQWDIHNTDDRNPHAHIMWTTRTLDDCQFGKKVRVLDDLRTKKAELVKIRAMVADKINQALAEANLSEKWTHESYEARGIDKTPTKHRGAGTFDLENWQAKTKKASKSFESDFEKRKAKIEKFKSEITRKEKVRENSDDLKTKMNIVSELRNLRKNVEFEAFQLEKFMERWQAFKDKVEAERREFGVALEPEPTEKPAPKYETFKNIDDLEQPEPAPEYFEEVDDWMSEFESDQAETAIRHKSNKDIAGLESQIEKIENVINAPEHWVKLQAEKRHMETPEVVSPQINRLRRRLVKLFYAVREILAELISNIEAKFDRSNEPSP